MGNSPYLMGKSTNFLWQFPSIKIPDAPWCWNIWICAIIYLHDWVIFKVFFFGRYSIEKNQHLGYDIEKKRQISHIFPVHRRMPRCSDSLSSLQVRPLNQDLLDQIPHRLAEQPSDGGHKNGLYEETKQILQCFYNVNWIIRSSRAMRSSFSHHPFYHVLECFPWINLN